MILDLSNIPTTQSATTNTSQKAFSRRTMNTLNYLNSSPINSDSFASSITAIRTNLYSSGICWTDDAQGRFIANVPFRVILYTRGANIDFKNPMCKECNGLVLEYNNGWKLLAMPQPAFCTNKISMKKLNDVFKSGGYDVYEVLDATILTLYYYNNSWRVSSTKGYDIGSTEMVEGMSFIEAIQDLMDTKYKAFRFEDLNQNWSYTIALRHSKYHIFDETKHLANRTKHVPRAGVDMNSYIMVMSVADTSSASYVEKHVSGLPYQSPITIKDQNAQTLFNYAKSAYTKYAKAHTLQNFKYKPLYGYILRANRRSVPDEYSTIYIESDLYRIIKSGLYKDNTAIRKLDYNQLMVQMILNHDRFEQYKIIFQQFEPKFKQLEEVIDSVAAEVAQHIIREGSSDEDQMVDVDENIIPEIARSIVSHFKNEPNITQSIIKDALYSKQYLQQVIRIV